MYVIILYTTWRHKLCTYNHIYMSIIICIYNYICIYHVYFMCIYVYIILLHVRYHYVLYTLIIYIYIYLIWYLQYPNLSQLLLPRHFRLPIPASADFPHVVPGVATAPPAQWRAAAPLAVPGRRGRALRSGHSGSGSSAGARGNDAWRSRDGQSFTIIIDINIYNDT